MELSSPMLMSREASIPIEKTLYEGDNVLYRSGTYVIKGDASGATLRVARDALISLQIESLSLPTLIVYPNTMVTISFAGQNHIGSIQGDQALFTFDGTGHLTVDHFSYQSTVMLSGSMAFPSGVQSANGLIPYSFDAQGTNRATVEGQTIPYTAPNAQNQQATLWLPVPSTKQYQSSIQDGTLCVTSALPIPVDTTTYSLSSADPFVPSADTTYTITEGDQPLSQTLIIDQAGVTLVLKEIQSAPSILANQPVTVVLQNDSKLGTLTGDITLKASTATVTATTTAQSHIRFVGQITLALTSGSDTTCFSSLQSLQAPSSLSLPLRAQIDDTYVPICFVLGQSTFYVQKASDDMTYHPDFTTNIIDLRPLPSDQMMPPSGETVTLDQSGEYVLMDNAKHVIVSENKTVSITCHQQTAVSLTLEKGSSATLHLVGCNAFTQGITLLEKARLAIDGEGNLVSSFDAHESAICTVDPSTNVITSTFPNSQLKPSYFQLEGTNSTLVSMQIGNDPPFIITPKDGQITLWQADSLHQVAVVVEENQNTYAGIALANETITPTALPILSNVEINGMSLLFTAEDAKTMGISYLLVEENTDPLELADTFVKEATLLLMEDGQVTIPEIPTGYLLVARAFACFAPDIPLNENTANAFAFSEIIFMQMAEPEILVPSATTDPMGVIDPVYQTVTFADGETLTLCLRTAKNISINNTYYGELVTDTKTGKDRSVFTNLRMHPNGDRALLILQADAETQNDGGYQTTASGTPLYQGRTLTLRYSTLQLLASQKVLDLAFSLGNATLFFSPTDLMEGGSVENYRIQNGITKAGTNFQFVLEPVQSVADLLENETSARGLLTTGTSLMRIGAYLVNGDARYDISHLLNNAYMLFDATNLLLTPQIQTLPTGIVESQQGQSIESSERVQATVSTNGYDIYHFGLDATLQDSQAVMPYTTAEQTQMPYTAIMGTNPYLYAPFTASGLYAVTNTQILTTIERMMNK